MPGIIISATTDHGVDATGPPLGAAGFASNFGRGKGFTLGSALGFVVFWLSAFGEVGIVAGSMAGCDDQVISSDSSM
jgi:hypothetical protein